MYSEEYHARVYVSRQIIHVSNNLFIKFKFDGNAKQGIIFCNSVFDEFRLLSWE